MYYIWKRTEDRLELEANTNNNFTYISRQAKRERPVDVSDDETNKRSRRRTECGYPGCSRYFATDERLRRHFETTHLV